MPSHDPRPADPPRASRTSTAVPLTFRRTNAGLSSFGQTSVGRTRKSSPDEQSAPPTQELDLLEATRVAVLGPRADLPVLPAVAMEALRLVRDPRVRTDELLGVVEQDPPLAARILAVANSTYYARGASISSLRHAVVRLGLHALRDVIYMAVYANTVFDAPGLVEVVRATFDHCVVVARLSQRLAPQVGVDHETAFLAGLLHDVGRARCIKVLAKLPQARGRPRAELEAVADTLHEPAGAALATAWKLPVEVVDACARHHDPITTVGSLVCAADLLAHHLDPLSDEATRDVGRAALGTAMARIGLTVAEVEGLVGPLESGLEARVDAAG
ncbi:MAG: HDOD domain-containing protein [Deltaproteobacteria bacterium]|nr:HDOD domain-containing protein [Deltaproteobacteria bacterium]